MFIAIKAALFTKREKQLKCPSTDKWINGTWYICTMKYYSAKKRNEALIHATTWVNLKNTMLSERSQTQMSDIA